MALLAPALRLFTVFALLAFVAARHPPVRATDGATDGGQGAFRFRYRPDLLELPAGVEMSNGHGLAKGPDGR